MKKNIIIGLGIMLLGIPFSSLSMSKGDPNSWANFEKQEQSRRHRNVARHTAIDHQHHVEVPQNKPMFALQLSQEISFQLKSFKNILDIDDSEVPIEVPVHKKVALPGDHQRWQKECTGYYPFVSKNKELLGFYSILQAAQRELQPSSVEWVQMDVQDFLCLTVDRSHTKATLEANYKPLHLYSLVTQIHTQEEFDTITKNLLRRYQVRRIINRGVDEYLKKASCCFDASLCNVSCLPLCFLRCCASRTKLCEQTATPQERIAHAGINDYLGGHSAGQCSNDTACQTVSCIDSKTDNGPCFVTCCPRYYIVNTKTAQRIAAKYPPTALEMKRD